MIRLFTAIEIPPAVRQHLALLQGGIPGARWSVPENLHLTLRFVGEVDEAVARDIDSVLCAVSAPPFTLQLRGVGTFGSRDPHAVWAGLAPCDALLHLVAKIERALQRMGLPAETRKYSPHVTLAWLANAPAAKVSQFVLGHAQFESVRFAVQRFALFSSHPTSAGSRYVLESAYDLND